MADEDTYSARDAEQALVGRALRSLRERVKKTQGEAGAGCAPAMTSQGWQKYEAGERKFTRDVIERLTRALGADPNDLARERSRILGEDHPAPMARGVGEREQTPFVLAVTGRARAGEAGPAVFDDGDQDRFIDLRNYFGPGSKATVVAGESMIPWANSGSVVLYDVGAWPRRDEGCVIELTSGELLVKLYKRTDGAALYVEEINPERREIRLSMRDVKGVYAVTFRGS